MEHCDLTSSQFVLCIESTKKIVKQKTRAPLSISVTSLYHRDAAAIRIARLCLTKLASRIAYMRGTRMNTGNSQHRIWSRQNRDRLDASLIERCPRFHRTSAAKYFFVEKADPVVLKRIFHASRPAMRPRRRQMVGIARCVVLRSVSLISAGAIPRR